MALKLARSYDPEVAYLGSLRAFLAALTLPCSNETCGASIRFGNASGSTPDPRYTRRTVMAGRGTLKSSATPRRLGPVVAVLRDCLLYTSDAADD